MISLQSAAKASAGTLFPIFPPFALTWRGSQTQHAHRLATATLGGSYCLQEWSYTSAVATPDPLQLGTWLSFQPCLEPACPESLGHDSLAT